jgi:hypothetical protein
MMVRDGARTSAVSFVTRVRFSVSMKRTTDELNSEKPLVLSSAGKDAFHSVPLFSSQRCACFPHLEL